MGQVSKFWHRIAREQGVNAADTATLEMFEGITQAQISAALFNFDSDGEPVR